MKPSLPLKLFVTAFLIAVPLYLISYSGIEFLRTRHGPWLVTFTGESGAPTLVINQASLHIANLKITFPGQSAQTGTTNLLFALPREVPFDVPFGKCLFEDTTFQPGTVVFQIYGHEIQLLPRTLTIDKKERPWQSDVTISLAPVQ